VLRKNGMAIEYVNNQTDEMKMIAYKQNNYSYRYIETPRVEVNRYRRNQKLIEAI